MPTDQDTGKRRECTTVERVRVLEMSAQGFSQRGISKQLEIPRTTVRRIIKAWKTDQKLQPIPRIGRPKILNSRAKRRLYRISDANPYASLSEVATESGLNISAKTAGRVLRASGRRVRWARHKPFISAVNRRKRVSWARGQRHTTISQWEKRIFTDEIHVELSPRGLFPYVSHAKNYY